MSMIAHQNMALRKIKKFPKTWDATSINDRSSSETEGNHRTKPGTKTTGEYYRVIVRPKELFTSFRNQDVGRRGGLQRLAGKRANGNWSTHAWLINKHDAHLEGKKLIPDSNAAKELFDNLSSQPVQIKGDIFRAKDRR